MRLQGKIALVTGGARGIGHTLNVDGGFRAAGLMFRGDKAAPAS
jgi:short-subunit dehydrogenase involved in D-alanine esterification of teichoic acids